MKDKRIIPICMLVLILGMCYSSIKVDSNFDFTNYILSKDSTTISVQAKENNNEIFFLKDAFFNGKMISKWNNCYIFYLNEDQLDSVIKRRRPHKIFLIYTYDSEFSSEGIQLEIILCKASGVGKKNRLLQIIDNRKVILPYFELTKKK